MKIRAHSKSYLVELDDGSRWRIFPGDLDLTLAWKPETEIAVVETAEGATSHVLVSEAGPVRVIPADRDWPVRQVKDELKGG